MPFALFVAQAAADQAAPSPRLSVVAHCVYQDTTDITVCGRRTADRFRLPLLIERAPDRRDLVADKTRDLLHKISPIEAHSPFLVGGGTVGVTASVGFGTGSGAGDTRVTGERPLAP